MRISCLHPHLIALLTGALALGCSSDEAKDKPQSQKDGGGGSGGGGGAPGDAGPCTATVATSSDDAKTIQTAFENAQSDDTICLSPGTYELNRAIKLTAARNITFRGTGATRDDVVLDFSSQSGGDGGVSSAEGVLVETDGFTIENLWIRNTNGNGIKVHADNSVFRNIKVGWDPTRTARGAYALYPTGCNTTLMENNEVYGAADAGIYAGQCTHVIAHHNDAHDNVLGIEIENTTNAHVYENDVHGNTCGFLLDLLPDLDKKNQGGYLVHDNHVYDNNLANFAEPNTLAAAMPQGTGIVVLAASDVEIRNNRIEGNEGTGVSIVSYDIADLATTLGGGTPPAPDPLTNRWPERIYVHDNVFSNNGTKPVGDLYGILAQPNEAGTPIIPYDVVWDGVLKKAVDGGTGTPNAAAAQICLGTTNQATFLNFHLATSLFTPADWTTDVTDHSCTLPAIPPLTP